ncbi:hypothetical protein I5G62_gp56 [Mycobacterium phage CRB2]|uniref:DUF6378 domain-containing protein n=1 Tax=Mycobacterium phage CRB2 TaxID=2483623 RepID=A0A455LM22_9CAUD|nr:hypothetical protein I5G62_gp56 [Mycobacterium phage CRB2]AYP70042.1 hypothetical protein CRB2_56 [Mycobacterium phage CRB2]
MSQSDDIEVVKRAADGQRRATGEHLPEQGCCGSDHPLEDALRAAEGWTGPGPQLYADPPPIEPVTRVQTERDRVLRRASEAISGERQRSYGSPEPSFTRIGKMWAAILGLEEVTAEQYALCMIAVKLGRLAETPNHTDSWDDAVGYAALGAEVAATEGRYL